MKNLNAIFIQLKKKSIPLRKYLDSRRLEVNLIDFPVPLENFFFFLLSFLLFVCSLFKSCFANTSAEHEQIKQIQKSILNLYCQIVGMCLFVGSLIDNNNATVHKITLFHSHSLSLGSLCLPFSISNTHEKNETLQQNIHSHTQKCFICCSLFKRYGTFHCGFFVLYFVFDHNIESKNINYVNYSVEYIKLFKDYFFQKCPENIKLNWVKQNINTLGLISKYSLQNFILSKWSESNRVGMVAANKT